MYETFNFDKISSGEIHLYVNESNDYADSCAPGGFPRGKTAYVCKDNKDSGIIEHINYNADSRVWPKTTNPFSLFISPASNIPRDAVRNSGYKIVRDKEKASYVVIPEPKDCKTFAFNILAVYESCGEKCACLYSLVRHRVETETIGDERINKIKQAIISDLSADENNIRFIYSNNLASRKIYFLQKCQEYEMIARGEKIGHAEFVLDNDIELLPSVNISIDTLITWKASDSDDLLRKAIMQSDWKKYPVTLCAFLAAENPYIDSGANGYFRDILGAIHFNEFRDTNKMTDAFVSAEDYKMLSDWILLQFGANDNNGKITHQPENRANRIYSRFVAKRTVARAIPMPNSMTLENLLLSVENMSS